VSRGGIAVSGVPQFAAVAPPQRLASRASIPLGQAAAFTDFILYHFAANKAGRFAELQFFQVIRSTMMRNDKDLDWE
jgi:hypothetical protein